MGATESMLAAKPWSEACKTFIKVLSPIATPDEAGKRARTIAWMAIDPNGNGQVSLAEADGWVKKVLQGSEGEMEGERVWRCFRPSFIRAFNDAKDMGGKGKKVTRNSNEGDYVQRKELRGLIAYFCIYAIMYDAFALIDGGGGTVEEKTGDDRRITLKEWTSTWSEIKAFGFVVMDRIHSDQQAVAQFKIMDKDGKGMVLLDEFCSWIEQGEVAEGTAWGALLTIGEGIKNMSPAERAAEKRRRLTTELQELQHVEAKVKARIKEIKKRLAEGT